MQLFLQRGGGSVFSTWRGRETHPSTPSRCTETSRGTEGGHSLQSFYMQDIGARQVTLPLGPCCSGKHRRQQLLSQQGCRERPLQRHRDSQPTAELQQMLLMQSAVLGILNRLGKLLPEVKQFGILLGPRLDHLTLINPSNLSLINLGSLQPSAGRSFPCRKVEQAWGCREENLPCDH